MNEKLFKNKYRIDSTRLKRWDYATHGYYFITICAHNKIHFFGEIKNGEMILSEIGKIVRHEWIKTGHIRTNMELDEFIIMPDHMHGIVIINRDAHDNTRNGIYNNVRRDEAPPRLYPRDNHGVQNTPRHTAHHRDNHGVHRNQYNGKYPRMSKISPKPNSLPTIIGSYKSACTKKINIKYEQNNFRWQTRYHDRIIRTDTELYNVRKYIRKNPEKWGEIN